MTRIRIFFGSILALAVVASVMVERQAQLKFRENETLLRQQEPQLSELASENLRLSGLIEQAKTNRVPAEDRTAELARLRTKLNAMRQKANQLAKQVEENRRQMGDQFLSTGQSNIPQHNHVMASTMSMEGDANESAKLHDAMTLTAALHRYTDEHQGQFPVNLNQITPYLPTASDAASPSTANVPLTGTNDFEVVFQGSQNDLTNIPPNTVTLIRERQPWQTPAGNWARVYGFADSAVIIESDDNFQSWDAQHLIPAQANR